MVGVYTPLPVADLSPRAVVQQQGRSCSFIVITEVYDGGVIRHVDFHYDATALKTQRHKLKELPHKQQICGFLQTLTMLRLSKVPLSC